MSASSTRAAAFCFAIACCSGCGGVPDRSAASTARLAEEVSALRNQVAALEGQLAAVRTDLAQAKQREDTLRDALAPLEEKLTQFGSSAPDVAQAQPSQDSLTSPAPSQTAQQPTGANCQVMDTGDIVLTNTLSKTVFTFMVYYRLGSDESRTLIVRPGETERLYGFPSGPHNYVITFRGQVPLMSFPPGAPLVERDLIHRQGQINIETCKTATMEIR